MKATSIIKKSKRFKKAFLVLCAIALSLSSVPFFCIGDSRALAADDYTAQQSTETVEAVVQESNTTDESASVGASAVFADNTQTASAEIPQQQGISIASGSASEASSAEQSSQENNDTAVLASAPLLAGVSPFSMSGSVGTLNVQLSNSGGTYTAVSTFTDGKADWAALDTRTMHVDFEFSSGGSNKTILVNVPTGYIITGYTATSATGAISGVQKIDIDPDYQASFSSSTLTATDGSSDWSSQVVSGYTPAGQSTEQDVRTYGGQILYTFTSSATVGEIVVTMKPQDNMLSHITGTETLDAVTVTMSSSAGSVSESFAANVTGIPLGYLKDVGTTIVSQRN